MKIKKIDWKSQEALEAIVFKAIIVFLENFKWVSYVLSGKYQNLINSHCT
jgi:hypothetical protein